MATAAAPSIVPSAAAPPSSAPSTRRRCRSASTRRTRTTATRATRTATMASAAGGGAADAPVIAASSAAAYYDRVVDAIIIGGSSGMGKAAAIEVVRRGGKVHIGSRSRDRVDRAAADIAAAAAAACNLTPEEATARVTTGIVDSTEEDSVKVGRRGNPIHKSIPNPNSHRSVHPATTQQLQVKPSLPAHLTRVSTAFQSLSSDRMKPNKSAPRVSFDTRHTSLNKRVNSQLSTMPNEKNPNEINQMPNECV